MIKDNEPYLIEYNVRMGDPECQTIIPKLESDLFDIILSCCDENLDKININWNKKKSLSIVLCSKGYPDEFRKNVLIKNIENIKIDKNNFCFHAVTKINVNNTLATGGRVLNFVSISENFLKQERM